MKQIIERMQSPTPKFFRYIRNVGLALTAISAVVSTAPISLPLIVVQVAGYLAVAGGIASAISQTVVEHEEED